MSDNIHPIVPFGMAATHVAIARTRAQGKTKSDLQAILDRMNDTKMAQAGSALALEIADELTSLAKAGVPKPVDEAISKAVNQLKVV